ncbi:MAG: dual specificity protein phosphatase family protein [Cyanobacteria bacterium SZAS LIN-2]|nr:dual specificity protein phosphatase family protein [Cyanobacteria bacterium SZAS LIN-2]
MVLALTLHPPARAQGETVTTVESKTVETRTVQQTMVPGSTLDTISSDIGNFQVVSSGLWRGAMPSHKAIEKLAKSGVKTIVDLRYQGASCEKEAEVARQLGVNYVNIPLGFEHPSLGNVAKFLAIVSKPANQPVFVHCRQGADRTGTLIGVFRIMHDHWSFTEAYNEMRSHHFKPFLSNLKSLVARCEREPKFSKELEDLAGKMDQSETIPKISVKAAPSAI